MMNRLGRRISLGIASIAGLTAAWLIPAKLLTGEGHQVICSSQADYSHRRLDSDVVENICSAYRGQVMLVVNTASRCAFTGQYEGLEKLYARYREKGLVVLGFPSNDFAGQEPGNEQSIKQFCRMTYGVRFPMYAKTKVKGEGADPLFRALTEAAGSPPRWNFYKYLIDREGRLIGSFSSFTGPMDDTLIDAIEQVL